MLDLLKGYFVQFIVSKILQVLSGVFLALGLSTTEKYSLEEIITAIVLFIVGTIVSYFRHKKALLAQPPK